MNSRKTAINIGFENCVFLSRDEKTIEHIINDKVSDLDVAWTSKRPISVKVERIDAMHDLLSLGYDDDNNVEGTITWRPSANGKHYVFSNFE
jgi:hypothetical protein